MAKDFDDNHEQLIYRLETSHFVRRINCYILNCMDKLYFATTNEGKLKEAQSLLQMEVEGIPLDIDEIQSLDFAEVATKKAKAYYSELKKPIFVEDTGLVFNALNGLPGTYTSDFLKALGNQGLLKLLENQDDRSAYAQTTIVFVDERGKEHVFEGSVYGQVADEPRGEGFGWDPIFIPEGEEKTFGEMSMEEKNNFSMRAKAMSKMKEWLEELESN